MKGCFHCMNIFPETEITKYDTDIIYKEKEGHFKPFCPNCNIDSVVNLEQSLKILHKFYCHNYKL